MRERTRLEKAKDYGVSATDDGYWHRHPTQLFRKSVRGKTRTPQPLSPRASAEIYTLRQRRKENVRKQGDQPRSDAGKTQEETEARRGRRVTENCEPHSTGLRRPPRFQTMSFSRDLTTSTS